MTFVSCWTELNETQQNGLIESFELALTSQDMPEITQTLLNLAEFMEHCDKVKQIAQPEEPTRCPALLAVNLFPF